MVQYLQLLRHVMEHDRLRHADDKSTIGLILCQDKNKIVAEYALRGVKKAIGVK